MKKKLSRKKSRPGKPNLSRLASKLNVSRTTLYEWQRAGAPIERGEAAIVEWAISDDRKGRDHPQLKAARLEVLNQTAERIRLGNAEKRRETIPFATVNHFIADLVTNCFFAELQRLQHEWPGALLGKDAVLIHAEIERGIEKVKLGLTQKLSDLETLGK